MTERIIDMNYLIFAWQDDYPDNAYYLDVETGNVQLVQRGLLDLDELTDEIESDRDRYLYVPTPDASELRQDIDDFVATVGDAQLRNVLQVVAEAPNALAPFKQVLIKAPGETDRWEQFRKARVADRVERWLKANFVVGEDQSLCKGGQDCQL